MINYIWGKIIKKEKECVVLENSGIGYKILVSDYTLKKLPAVGEETKIWTSWQIRENLNALFGFDEEEMLQFFETLIQISGVGPRMALNILSLPLSSLKKAIIEEDVKALTTLPHIGKRMAQKIILELKDKIFFQNTDEEDSTVFSSTSPYLQAVAGLISLGYTKEEAKKAVDAVKKKGDKCLPAEEIIKEALKSL